MYLFICLLILLVFISFLNPVLLYLPHFQSSLLSKRLKQKLNVAGSDLKVSWLEFTAACLVDHIRNNFFSRAFWMVTDKIFFIKTPKDTNVERFRHCVVNAFWAPTAIIPQKQWSKPGGEECFFFFFSLKVAMTVKEQGVFKSKIYYKAPNCFCWNMSPPLNAG